MEGNGMYGYNVEITATIAPSTVTVGQVVTERNAYISVAS
jgi:hypothetical protein